MAVKLNSSSGGSVTLQEPTTASNYTLSLPAQTGTVITTASTFAGTGPAFAANNYTGSTQSISAGSWVKATMTNELFDTANCYSSSRFTPTVAGYYQFNGTLRGEGTSVSTFVVEFYKNGTSYSRGGQISSTSSGTMVNHSDLIYCNGTTDYVEFYVFINGATAGIGGADPAVNTRFSGFLARTA
jgi:hypothetical protein